MRLTEGLRVGIVTRSTGVNYASELDLAVVLFTRQPQSDLTATSIYVEGGVYVA